MIYVRCPLSQHEELIVKKFIYALWVATLANQLIAQIPPKTATLAIYPMDASQVQIVAHGETGNYWGGSYLVIQTSTNLIVWKATSTNWFWWDSITVTNVVPTTKTMNCYRAEVY